MSLGLSKVPTRQQPTDEQCRAMKASELIFAGAIFSTLSSAKDVRADNAAAREILRRLTTWESEHAEELRK